MKANPSPKRPSGQSLPTCLFYLLLCVAILIPWTARAAVVDQSGTIAADTSWTSGNVYRIVGSLTVNAGVTLSIEPGTVVKFNQGTELIINGVLDAAGNSSQQIVFTSWRDDSVGGDTNGDGPSQGRPGDWRRIYFGDSVTESLTRFDNIIVRYGGRDNYATVETYRADITIASCAITDNAAYGVYGRESSLVVRDSLIADNGTDGVRLMSWGATQLLNNTIRNNGGQGIQVWDHNSTVTIRDNRILDNGGWGVYFRSNQSVPTPVLTGNTVTGNQCGLMIPFDAMPNSGDGNILLPNTIDGVWLRGTGRDTDLRLEVITDGSGHEINTYRFNGTATINAGARLTIDPGVVVKFYQNAGLTVHGALDAKGTADLPIAFTSWKDDEFGGDLNGNGNADTPRNGDWYSIYISDQADMTLCESVPGDGNLCGFDHVTVRYGGGQNYSQFYVYRNSFTISNSTFSNSSTHGMRFYEADMTVQGCEIFGNSWSGISLEGWGTHSSTVTNSRLFANFGHGIAAYHSSAVDISASELFGNLGNGAFRRDSATITALDNWWGAADGPGGDFSGSGDEIAAGVVISDAGGDNFRNRGSALSYVNAGSTETEGTIAAPTLNQVPPRPNGTQAPPPVSGTILTGSSSPTRPSLPAAATNCFSPI